VRIYNLSCVLYEMPAGPPFSRATAQEIVARRALDPMPSLGPGGAGDHEGAGEAAKPIAS
jgi:hypothetical protein